jgi:hypothetical protein
MGKSAPARVGPWRRANRYLAVVVVALLVGIGAGSVLLALSNAPASSPPSIPASVTILPGPPANANLTAPTGPPTNLDNGRLGVDLRADVPLTTEDANYLNQTGAHFVRWPGGALGDRFDPLLNAGVGVIYELNGTVSTPATTYAQFVDWCRATGCQSIVTLPAEIDNALIAQQIVSYSLNILGFHPSYWEIGNEPEQWTHFGIPWTAWNATEDTTATPTEFAHLVQQYVLAIRVVDPTTPILGIGGVGAGGSQSQWIADDVALNGPNLSGVAIHVYPASTITGPEPPATWFNSLQGSTALPARVNSTRHTASSACPTCDLAVVVDEVGSGTSVPPGDGLEGGYLATYVLAEIAQSVSLNATSFDYYDLQSGTPGAWFSTSGVPSPAFFAYLNWYARMGGYAAPLGVHSGAPGLLAVAGGPLPGTLTNLIVINTNVTRSYTVDIPQIYPGSGKAEILGWDGPAAAPTNLTWGPGGPTNVTVPPMSFVMFSNLGTPVFSLEQAPGSHRVPAEERVGTPPPNPNPRGPDGAARSVDRVYPIGTGPALSTVTHRRLLAGAARS